MYAQSQDDSALDSTAEEAQQAPPNLAQLLRARIRGAHGNAYTIEYRPARNQRKGPHGQGTVSPASAAGFGERVSQARLAELSLPPIPHLETVVEDPAGSAIQLLRLLYILNVNRSHLLDNLPTSCAGAEVLNDSAFVNHMLSTKLLREVSNFSAISKASFQAWCTALVQLCPCLVPFAQRMRYFRYTAFGAARAMQFYRTEMQGSNASASANNGAGGSEFRLTRTKVSVPRDGILEAAHQVLFKFGELRTVLEVQFTDEVGTGLGPTLEFYALASRELQRADLALWRGEAGEGAEYVHPTTGLYPRPTFKPNRRTLVLFETMGLLVAKAVQDERVVDLPLNPLWFRWLLPGPTPGTLADLRLLDESLHHSLEQMSILADRWAEAQRTHAGDAKGLAQAAQALNFQGAAIEDLGLTFVLPGYDVELKSGGASMDVTLENLAEYVKLVLDWSLRRGVQKQMQAFLRGFDRVVPREHLAIFNASEVAELIGGHNNLPWGIEDLRAALKTNYGYTMDSPQVAQLLEILASFGQEERRAFVQFLTGSPNLPVGGFASLQPPLTVVRKDPEGAADAVLPSVMTCQNYLKLPPYSGLEVMRDRLRFAMFEGQGSFDLS
ncbi:uncharacterized protein MONBRDRAFT_15214 [Monosiga brevicollis MX1]|uniref:HECT domain-containing protein n=1 Tax=Monosiga brevicollis TaxID=81824 RepID=A9UTU0_MONBE|nr:uncharacterized protein MONBRDRAFT_15214 [Monosiga brevicollis MX1]EDQ91305.1 predicted protein [Monosiga brevicollis MX1]|eukprot:XP_001743727.1 hypothetical protein [Monosiga brevicollis MX1]